MNKNLRTVLRSRMPLLVMNPVLATILSSISEVIYNVKIRIFRGIEKGQKRNLRDRGMFRCGTIYLDN